MSRTMTIGCDEPSLGCDEADGALLGRFLVGRDEGAFELLVMRHGPRVLRICRSWLGDGQDAEDACQATFLVLVRRGGEIRQAESVGAWLGGVARRVAGRAKQQADRRRIREGAAVDVRDMAGRDAGDDDLAPALRAEVGHLPEKYRRPIELCYWEGLSSEEAAERLHCPTGTLKWRLSRAREMLRSRLARLGLTLAALLLWKSPTTRAAGFVLRNPAGGSGLSGSLPPAFVRETVALAAYVRDSSPSLAAEGTGRSASEKSPGRGRFLKVAGLVAVLLAIVYLLANSAVGGPWGAAWKPTACTARSTAESREDATPKVATGDAESEHHCR